MGEVIDLEEQRRKRARRKAAREGQAERGRPTGTCAPEGEAPSDRGGASGRDPGGSSAE